MVNIQKVSVVLVVCFAALVFLSCNEFYRNQSHASVPLSNIRKGRELAARYCGNCHLVPDPSLLTPKVWEQGVLPQMGPRLGIEAYGFQLYPSAKSDRFLQSNYYPSAPVVSPVEWQYIIDYYTATSPDTLVVETKPLPEKLPLFSVEFPAYKNPFPMASYVGFNERRGEAMIYDIHTQHLLFFDSRLHLTDSLMIPGAVSGVLAHDTALVCINMGDINPSNAPAGNLQLVHKNQTGVPTLLTLAAQLQRPVALQQADLDKDGLLDYVVGSFGYLTGHLSWYQQMRSGSFAQHVIKPIPGAAQIVVTDDNKDGLPDLWVLFAQGDESIRKFINTGKGSFREEMVLRFPPVYGSTSFALVDMDGDGDQDIVYTCGDNADYSLILKPYHGVYVFLQDEGKFRQRYFFQLNGAFKAVTHDFDKDGDQDIAAISFFADYQNQPGEGFVFLENKGGFNFEAATFPQSKQGRWITLEAGDLDGDGWQDLILGNMAKPGSIVPPLVSWKDGPLFLLLRNKGKK